MKYVLCLAGLALSVFAYAQVPTDYVDASDINHSTWTTHVDNQNLKIELKRADCAINSGLDQQYIFVRLTNKTQNAMSLEWDMELYYNDDCKTCGVDEYHWNYQLAPSQTVEGECTLDADKRVRLFTKFLNYPNNSELTGFKFNNLTID